jgi:hypothetical protein
MSQTEKLSEREGSPPRPVELQRVGAGIDFSDPHSPLAPYYLRLSGVAAFGLVALVFIFADSIPLWHTDVWGHTKFGEWIWTHGRLPEHEPFCLWSDRQAPFVELFTLSQLAFYGLYEAGARLAGGDDLRQMAGGVEMLRLGFALLVTARFGLLLLTYRRLSGSTATACGALFLLLLLSLPTMGVLRPQLFGELLFALLLFGLSRPLVSWRFVAASPIVFLLWANLHGSFLVGLGLLAIFLTGRIIEIVQQDGWGKVFHDAAARRLLLALALGGAGACINAHGPVLFLYAVRMASHPALAPVLEWRPLGLYPAPFLVGTPFVGSLLLLALTQWRSRRPFTPTQVLLVVVFGVGACMQQRVLIWWVMLTLWVAVSHWTTARAAAPTEDVRPGGASFRKTLLAAAMVFTAVMWAPTTGWLLHGSPRQPAQLVSPGTPWQLARQLRRPDDPQAQWSTALAAALRAHYPQGRFTGGILASESQGDYLIWALDEQTPVSSYAHLHLFPRNYWEEMSVIYGGAPGWWDLLRRRQANLVVIEAEIYPQLRDKLKADPGWEVVFDETGDARKIPNSCRLFVALRKKPI